MKLIHSLLLLAAAPALAAAQVPIKSLPFVIEKPGSYMLVRTLGSETMGITVAASHVTIDLNGFALLGLKGSGAGVWVRTSEIDVAVSNGTISGWGGYGLIADEAMNVYVHDLRVSGNGLDGLRVGPSAIVSDVVSQANGGSGLIGLDGLVASGLSISGNALWGLQAGPGSVLTGNSVTGNFGGGILLGDTSRATGNTVVGNGHLEGPPPEGSTLGAGAGITVSGTGAWVADNVINGNGVGLQLMQGGNGVAGNVVKTNRVNYDFVGGNQLDLLVSELPLKIQWPAVVRLAGTLVTAEGDGLVVQSDEVTIDLGGHDLVARDGSGSGILVDGVHMGLTVRNGGIRGWLAAGIDARTANGSLFENLALHDNGAWGLHTGDGCKVLNVIAHANDKDGILVGVDSLVEGCTVTGNGNDGIHLGDHSLALNCVASENYLFGIRVFSGATVKGCTASGNNMGIAADENATIQDCTVSANTLIGIRVDKGSMVQGNTVQGSETGIAVMYGPGNRMAHNNLTGNKTGLGIYGAGNIAYCNTATANDVNYFAVDGNAVARIYIVTGDPDFWLTDPWGNLSY